MIWWYNTVDKNHNIWWFISYIAWFHGQIRLSIRIFPATHEDYRCGRRKGIKKNKNPFMCLAAFQNACTPSVRVSICSEEGIHCSSAGEFTAELPKWQDRQKNTATITRKKKCSFLWLFISTYNVAPAYSFMQRTIICVTGDALSRPTLAHSWVKVVLLVKPGYLISSDGLSQWLPNIHS